MDGSVEKDFLDLFHRYGVCHHCPRALLAVDSPSPIIRLLDAS